MKKILFLLVIIFCCGCTTTDVRESVTYDEVPLKIYVSDASKTIYMVEIEGHIYVVFSGHHKGGIIHAEHCPCKNK